ncbi:MAG: hypothetical protein C4560_03630 [Nitrospiraceae bacterium]|nr:MAG: hypothetical protein C4560_03630 [Nitrospiraceae bacterium]
MSLKLWSDNHGIALIMVLWVLAILTVIALSFSFAVRVDTHSTMAFKEEVENKFLAEAGAARGVTEIFYRNANKGQRVILEGMETWRIDGKPYEVRTDAGYFTVSITDEAGKVDINMTPDIILRNLLGNLDLGPEHIDTIADSILDWKDPDELHRLHGAESDYYMSLPNPYGARNAPFETLEELLMVKGITPGILYGSRESRGLIEFITVNSRADRINLNSAPKEVLISVPGITSEIADEIMTLRQDREINYLLEIKGLSEQRYSLIEPYLGTEDSQVFTIVSAGHRNNKKAGYGITETIAVTGENSYDYLYYKKGTSVRQ